jgi:hypothetical protein
VPQTAHTGRRPRSHPQSGPRHRTGTNTLQGLYRPIDTGKVSLRFAGRLRHLGIGRAHAGTAVLVLTAETDAAVLDPATGEILADFTFNLAKDYQGKKKHPGPKTGV